jgi:hypothetical protein
MRQWVMTVTNGLWVVFRVFFIVEQFMICNDVFTIYKEIFS